LPAWTSAEILDSWEREYDLNPWRYGASDYSDRTAAKHSYLGEVCGQDHGLKLTAVAASKSNNRGWLHFGRIN